jgi:hypothetical protein
MRFWEAMKIVDEGGKIRRDVWAEGLYVYKDNFNGLMLVGLRDTPISYEMLVIDPIQGDWSEVDSESIEDPYEPMDDPEDGAESGWEDEELSDTYLGEEEE